jgi:hypothetical protein
MSVNPIDPDGEPWYYDQNNRPEDPSDEWPPEPSTTPDSFEDPQDPFVDIPDDYSEDKYKWWHEAESTPGFQTMSGTSMKDPQEEANTMFDYTSKGHASHMSGTSMRVPFMMMIIIQLRMFLQQLQAQGISNHTLRTAIYALLRIQLNKAVCIPPGTDESLDTAIDDVKNFNNVADCLFAAYAKDRSLCREGLTTVLTGDNFTITLNMFSPNSASNATGQSSK